MKIVVKVGTQSLLSPEGLPFEEVIHDIVVQLAELQASEHNVMLISSGAVGFGRSMARQQLGKEYGTSIEEKQILASLGQPALMQVYTKMFQKYNMLVSQLLLTKQDFQTRKHYLNISRLIREILAHKNIIPIINENDSVAIEELMFTDNDELAGLIAAQINANKLIILSNIEGVYTGHPSEPDAKLIPIIDPANGWPNISSAKSTHGRGGMISKLSTARKMAKLGIMTHIASINQPNIIKRLVMNEQVGTTILPAKKQSSIKRWIAYSAKQKTGAIRINAELYKILQVNQRVVSILPIGIEAVQGDFKAGDIIEILAPNNIAIGMGIARYDVHRLRSLLMQQNKPVFIHYDHLHIF